CQCCVYGILFRRDQIEECAFTGESFVMWCAKDGPKATKLGRDDNEWRNDNKKDHEGLNQRNHCLSTKSHIVGKGNQDNKSNQQWKIDVETQDWYSDW